LGANEEDPGAFVHFNLDNDNDSDNSSCAPKRPGADYNETSGSVSDENDLKSLTMALEPTSLDIGSIVLSIPGSAKVWKSATKGSSNLVLASGSKTWDLSNSGEKSEFLSLCSSGLYVEGISTGSGNIVLQYKDTSATMRHCDTVKYTFIAADCGDQPKTSTSQRSDFEGAFPNLKRCEWSITHNVRTMSYNCIAWSVDETGVWYQPWDIDISYGDADSIFEDADMDAFYGHPTKKGWSLITSGSAEAKANSAEAMYYSYGTDWDYINDPPPSIGYHAARRMTCTCGAQQWIIYGSKCGGWERIEHVWDQLNGSNYGDPDRFYK